MTVATFHDDNLAAPASDFTATVTWADQTATLSGSGGGIVALGNGDFALLAGRAYAEEGATATLSVQVQDMGGSSVSGSFTVSVADAALSGLSIANPQATEGQGLGGFTVATFHDGALGTDAADFTATVSGGDSTPDSAASCARRCVRVPESTT